MLHPVLARPLVLRGSLPLRAAHRQLISALLIDIDITDVHDVVPDVRPPNRRHPHRELGASQK